MRIDLQCVAVNGSVIDMIGINTVPSALSPPLKQKRGGKTINVTKRNGVYYFRMLHRGVRHSQTLETADRQIAVARARALSIKVKGGKWEEIDGLKARNDFATIGEVLTVFRREALARLIKPMTIDGYCWCLSRMVRRVRGEMDVEKASTAILTEDLVADFERVTIKAAGNDMVKRERAQRSARAQVINARAIFAKWTRRAYKHLAFPPSLQSFREVSLCRAQVKSYRVPPGPLIDATMTEGHKLKETRPELYPIFLLCYYLGLRAGEAAACRWDWFAEARPDWGQQRMIEILRRPDFAPKWNKERRVPVSEDVWAELSACQGESDFVLRGESLKSRRDRIVIEFSQWMRSIGWAADTYSKAAHELRKLIGSKWYTELGAEVAQEWLGHESVATTCSFYAGLRRQPKALGLEAKELDRESNCLDAIDAR